MIYFSCHRGRGFFMSRTKATVSVERLTSFSMTAESCLFYLGVDMGWSSKDSQRCRAENPWITPFCSAKARCENSKNKRYRNYGGRGIKFKLTMEEIKTLWFRDNASDMETASIDRKYNDGHYTFDNCRFIEHAENSVRAKRIPVIQKTKEGEIVNIYPSMNEASRKTGIRLAGISCAARGIQKTAGGCKWNMK